MSFAVRRDGAAYRVFKVNSDSKAEVAEVQIGGVQDEWVETTAGRDEHAKVIAKDIESLTTGALVDAGWPYRVLNKRRGLVTAQAAAL